jgi:hypothetical protein
MNIVLHLQPVAIGCPHRVDVDAYPDLNEIALHDVVEEEDRPTARTILTYSPEEALLIGRALVAAAEAVLAAKRDAASLAADAAFLKGLGA